MLCNTVYISFKCKRSYIDNECILAHTTHTLSILYLHNSLRIKAALYLNFLSTQPPYVKHEMGYSLSPPSSKKPLLVLSRHGYGYAGATCRPDDRDREMWRVVWKCLFKTSRDHIRNPNQGDPVTEDPIYRRRGWKYHT